MCGIVGYTGTRPADGTFSSKGSARLEYRGYDSAGIAVEQDGKLAVVHRKGKVSGLAAHGGRARLERARAASATRAGPRTASPRERNAHPHTPATAMSPSSTTASSRTIAELREELEGRGPRVHERDRHRGGRASGGRGLRGRPRPAAGRARGGLAPHRRLWRSPWSATREPGTIVATRKDSPLVVGPGAKTAPTLPSDMIAHDRRHARRGRPGATASMAKRTPDGHRCYFNVRGEAYEPEPTHVDWDLDVAEKGGYPDFMMKEIHEQPRVIRDTLAGRLVNGALSIDELDLTHEELNLIDRVYVIACGTSYHAGLIAKNLIEGLGAHPLRGGGGQRAPLPQPHHHAVHAGGCRVAVGRDGRHAGRRARRPREGREGVRHHERGGARRWRANPTASSTRRRTRRSPSRRRSRFWARWCRSRCWPCCWRSRRAS